MESAKLLNPPFTLNLLQDLMTKNKQRYRRRMVVCGFVVIIVLALVIAAAILLTGSPDSSRTNHAPGISLEEWLSGSLSPKNFNGTWISGKCIFIPGRDINSSFCLRILYKRETASAYAPLLARYFPYIHTFCHKIKLS